MTRVLENIFEKKKRVLIFSAMVSRAFL